MKKKLSQLVCLMMIIAVAFAFTACGDKADDNDQQSEPSAEIEEQKTSEDGTATITHHDYIEVIDDITYHFVCEYVSSASGEKHEDETTYFEFMHAIESFKVKGE